jgi:hypothetical protein
MGMGYLQSKEKGAKNFPPFLFSAPFFVINIPIFSPIIYNQDVDYK